MTEPACQNTKPSYPALDLSKVETYPLEERPSKVHARMLAGLPRPDEAGRAFLETLPDILAARELRLLAERLVRSRRAGRAVVLAMGAHVIKCGLSPLVIDLMARGLITAVAMNGAGAIHDFELAVAGKTSEDVKAHLDQGRFGMAEETSAVYRRAAARAAGEGLGLGTAFGLELAALSPPGIELSILAAGLEHRVPVTVHVAFGTDIVHQTPKLNAGELGEATYTDFRILAACANDLEGGVWLNVGSAVILPEVFIKIVSIQRNLGNRLEDVVTADFDMIRHYRPRVNVLDRPARRGYAFTGHHEIMLPLLRLMLLARWQATSA